MKRVQVARKTQNNSLQTNPTKERETSQIHQAIREPSLEIRMFVVVCFLLLKKTKRNDGVAKKLYGRSRRRARFSRPDVLSIFFFRFCLFYCLGPHFSEFIFVSTTFFFTILRRRRDFFFSPRSRLFFVTSCTVFGV